MKKLLLSNGKFLFVVLSIVLSVKAIAQEKCLSGILHQRLMQSDATYRSTIEREENIIQQIIANPSNNRMAPVYRIPIVVHVIHLGEPVGTGTNISDEQIYSAIRSINDAFRKKAGSIYSGNGVDTEIEFCLAQKDAAGNSSTGILRVNGSGTSDYSTNGITVYGGTVNETSIKALSKWDNTKYYNVWIVSEIDGNNGDAGVQGYAYFPGAGPTLDGAVMIYNAFGYDPNGTKGYNLKSYTNLNATFIHEMGHALDLYHTFEGDGDGSICPTNTTCTTDGDKVCDTPPHKRSNSTCVADATANPCLGGGTVGAFQHNYMDYSSDDCKNMFSSGQSTRMRATLSGGLRSSLTSAANLTACGCDIPIIRFSATTTTPCVGFPVQFTDESLNFPTSWSWTFGSGSPGTSTSENPSITYNSSGSFNVTLQATVAGGSTKTLTKTGYINPPASATLPYTENFEGTFPPTGWSTISDDAPDAGWGVDGFHQWVKRPAPFNTGSTGGCAAINSYNYNSSFTGNPTDELISKSISLSGMATASMTFKVAYKYYNSPTNYDSLRVFVSTDCGATYGSAVYTKGGPTLATAMLNGDYTPTSTGDWRTETINLNSYAGQNIILKFIAYTHYGNNLYIDDINVTGTASAPVASVTITSSDADNIICAGNSVTFTATPTNGGTAPTYQWKIGTTNVGTGSTYTTTGLTNGQSVTCVMTSNLGGVTGSPATSNAIVTTVNAIPSAPTAGSNSPVCAGNTINLTSNTVASATYSWTGPNSFTSSSEDPTRTSSTTAMAGTYSVTVTVNGCTSATGTTAVVVNSIPATPTAGSNTPVCAGSTINLTANTVASATYAWTGPSSFTSSSEDPTRASSTTAMAGTYSVTVTVNGCTSAAGTTAVVVNPIPATPTITQTGNTLTSSSATGNQWYLNGNPIGGATAQNYTVTQSGDYTLRVTTSGCASLTSAVKTVVYTGIEILSNSLLFDVYPNPNDGNFIIRLDAIEKTNYTLQVKNMLNQVIYTEKLTNFIGSYSKEMDVTKYGSGMYFINLSDNKQEFIKKIMVQ